MRVAIAGAGITRFGFLAQSPRQLAATAIGHALDDASAATAGRLHDSDVGLVVVGNAAAGVLNGQEMIRAQTSLSVSRLVGVPSMTVENACASSSSALLVGCMAIESGMHDVVAVLGVEKMSGPDRSLPNRALATAMDIEVVGAHHEGPVFMEHYAGEAVHYMERSGATAHDFAAVAAKNSRNGSLNPVAMVTAALTTEQVLAARMIVDPLTRPMCSSIADGAAAIVLVSDEFARTHCPTAPRVLGIASASGQHDATHDATTPVERAARSAYERAGLGPADIDVVEVHDAAAPAELELVERLGFAAIGEAPALLRSGALDIGGARPVNTSGGLISRGHPIGATGVAQVIELLDQLRGRAGVRQIDGARIGLAQNAGGVMGSAPAVCVVSILGVP